MSTATSTATLIDRDGSRIAIDVLGQLGKGGEQTVYAAQSSDGSRFAIRVSHDEQPDQTAELLKGCKSRHLPTTHQAMIEFDGEQPRPCGTMPIYRGSLDDLNKCGQTTPNEAASIAMQVVLALRATESHESGRLVHGDIKPPNILARGGDGSIVLSDWGTAVRAGSPDRDFIIGSLPYLSPECVRSEKSITSARDVYAIGVTMSELVNGSDTGRRQFAQNATTDEKVCEIERPFVAPPTGNQRVDALIASCTRPTPQNRPSLAMLEARLSQIPEAAKWLSPAQKAACNDRLAALEPQLSPARGR